MRSVFFHNSNLGWAVGHTGIIISTSDGGINWKVQNRGTSEYLYSICFIDDSAGWAVGEIGTIINTNDGGNNWNLQTSGTIDNLNCVIFKDSYTGWAVGSEGSIIKTTAGGIPSKNEDSSKKFTVIKFNLLSQNYPNPFNPSTTIEFDLPKTSKVSLKVYNILGEEVATLLSASLLSGSHSIEWDASNLASGVYLYRLEAEGFVQTRKMILMK